MITTLRSPGVEQLRKAPKDLACLACGLTVIRGERARKRLNEAGWRHLSCLEIEQQPDRQFIYDGPLEESSTARDPLDELVKQTVAWAVKQGFAIEGYCSNFDRDELYQELWLAVCEKEMHEAMPPAQAQLWLMNHARNWFTSHKAGRRNASLPSINYIDELATPASPNIELCACTIKPMLKVYSRAGRWMLPFEVHDCIEAIWKSLTVNQQDALAEQPSTPAGRKAISKLMQRLSQEYVCVHAPHIGKTANTLPSPIELPSDRSTKNNNSQEQNVTSTSQLSSVILRNQNDHSPYNTAVEGSEINAEPPTPRPAVITPAKTRYALPEGMSYLQYVQQKLGVRPAESHADKRAAVGGVVGAGQR